VCVCVCVGGGGGGGGGGESRQVVDPEAIRHLCLILKTML